MATGDFDLYYPSNPWEGIVTNQRRWYDPILREIFIHQAMYARFVTSQYNLAGPRTTEMQITSLIPPLGNHDPLGVRALWMPSSYVDTFARVITFSRYGAKMAFHKYDDVITYFQQDRVAGLRAIVNRGLGHAMTEIMDKLARDAFLSNQFALYGQGTGTNFAAVTSSDTLTTTLIDDIHLGMAERGVPYASAPSGVAGNIVCVTSPGVVRDLQYEASAGGNANAFIDVMKYGRPEAVLNGEVGTYHHVRFLQTPRAILYNCGPITVQPTVTAAINAGDGAPNPASVNVDGVRKVGQTSGVTNYLQLSAVTSLAVNDIVTIHTDRTSAFGVTNGVDYRDGTLHNRRIISIDAVNNRVTLDLPIMTDFTTNLGGGVYAYLTKGRHIHTALFLGGADGVVMGIAQAPQIHTPPPVDDFDSMYRVSFDMLLGFQVFEPQVFEVWYGAGSNRIKGPRVVS